MKRIGHMLLAIGLSFVAPACSDDSGSGDEGYQDVLIEHEWQIDSTDEKFWCVRQTLTEDVYIAGFEAVAPPGSHHTVLSAGATPLGTDGVSECTSNEHNFENMVFETANGVNGFEMPEGVAVKLVAGEQLNFNIHVMNTGDSALTGVSAVKFKPADPATIEQYARSIYVGKLGIELPPQQETTLSSDCPLATDVTAFGVLPHMHAAGAHMTVAAQGAGEEQQMLFDEDFELATTKRYYPIDPVSLKADDVLQVTCTWFNATNETIYWGEAISDEMCFAGVYVYPAEGVNGYCAR